MTLFGKGGGDSNPFCWCTLESVLLLSSTVLVPGAVSSCPNQAYDNGCDGRRWGVSIEGVFAVQANLEAQVSLKGQRWKCLHTSACMCISFFFLLVVCGLYSPHSCDSTGPQSFLSWKSLHSSEELTAPLPARQFACLNLLWPHLPQWHKTHNISRERQRTRNKRRKERKTKKQKPQQPSCVAV